MAKSRQRMTRAELLAELERLREGKDEQALRRSVLELQIYREELRAQNDDLIRAQREIEISRDRYADLFDGAPVGYLTLDANGVVEEVNATGARLLERPRTRLLGTPFVGYVAEPNAFLDHMVRCRRGSDHVVSEIHLRTPGGRWVPVELVSHPSATLPTGWRTTLTDLTERQASELERRELELRHRVASEANEAKDRFLAILSHELRNPLAAIAAATDVLIRHPALPADLAPIVERIHRNAFAEARLITDLLDSSRLRHAKLYIERQEVDLHSVIEDAMAGFRANAPDLPIQLDLDAQRHTVEGDTTRLGQVISNLLRNALDATREGGQLHLTTRNSDPGRIVLSVSDSGKGIEPEDLERIFEPFEQRGTGPREKGLGLGLAIARGLVEAHGGKIQAYSGGRGRGARFDVELPLGSASESSPAEVAEPPETQTSALRILLVEDDDDTAQALALLLEQRGFQVIVASCVSEALARAEQVFDVLVSDLALPDGSGCDVVRKLSAHRPLRAIALSGFGSDADVQASTDAGFAAHLVKPVEPERLLRVIRRVAAA